MHRATGGVVKSTLSTKLSSLANKVEAKLKSAKAKIAKRKLNKKKRWYDGILDANYTLVFSTLCN